MTTIKIYGKREKKLLHRDQYLPTLVKHSTVLHVGCASVPVSIQEFKDGRLLHPMLVREAVSVIGIDLVKEGIEFLRSKGFTNLYVMNAEKIELDQKFDIIMAGDVLEHLSNPGLFLEQVPMVTVYFNFRKFVYEWKLHGRQPFAERLRRLVYYSSCTRLVFNFPLQTGASRLSPY